MPPHLWLAERDRINKLQASHLADVRGKVLLCCHEPAREKDAERSCYLSRLPPLPQRYLSLLLSSSILAAPAESRAGFALARLPELVQGFQRHFTWDIVEWGIRLPIINHVDSPLTQLLKMEEKSRMTI